MKTSPLTIKHVPFESIYRQEYEVVEEHRGNLRLYPHTDQLPIISRAINLEFYGALPNKVAHVDHRGDGFHKIILQEAALMFCAGVNGCRSDRLRFIALTDENLDKQFQWQSDLNQRVAERAGQVLTPAQLKEFTDFQTQQANLQKASMKMAREMFGGGKAPAQP